VNKAHRSEQERRAWDIAGTVPDPEIPAVTVADLGILRRIRTEADGTLVAELTPTYSGCPAVLAIENAVENALLAAGLQARVERVIAPAWTTDWITKAGKRKLKAYGIAPPVSGKAAKAEHTTLFKTTVVACPRCDSTNTQKVSEFGSTACKALYRCDACAEPFDYFKCL